MLRREEIQRHTTMDGRQHWGGTQTRRGHMAARGSWDGQRGKYIKPGPHGAPRRILNPGQIPVLGLVLRERTASSHIKHGQSYDTRIGNSWKLRGKTGEAKSNTEGPVTPDRHEIMTGNSWKRYSRVWHEEKCTNGGT